MSEKPERETVKDIDHTHPHTDETFGENGVYERGTGGEPEDDEDHEASEDEERETRSDGGRRRGRRRERASDHTPPTGDGVQPSFDRGRRDRK
jgi:hypothetical protein